MDSYNIDWDNNLVMLELFDDKIVIDNSIDNIKLDITSYGYGNINIYSNSDEINNNKYKVIHVNYDYDDIEMLKNIIEDLKKKRINKYDSYYEIEKIYISQENLTKLRENNRKYMG